MLKVLIKKQCLELFQNYFVDQKNGRARSKAGIFLYIAFAIVVFGGVGIAIYTMAKGMGLAILGHGINWFYFAIMGLIAIALGVFGSVFNTYASVYLPKDNEFLISLPIPKNTLLIARISGVYLTSLMYSAWIWIPAIIAYWGIVEPTVINVICPVILTFVLALFVTVLSCILGWLVALVAIKAKGKSILTVILSITVMALYYVIYFKIVGSLNEIINNLGQLSEMFENWLHFTLWLGKGADGDIKSLLLVVLVTVLLSVVCFIVMARTLTRLMVTENKSSRKKLNEDKIVRISSDKAILDKEFKLFLSTPTWMLNGGIGLLMLFILAVVAIIKKGQIAMVLVEIAAQIPQLYGCLPILLFATVGTIISMSAISCAAVSMEGKSIWIIQSLPIESWKVLKAKENMNVRINIFSSIPVVVVLGYILKLDVVNIFAVALAVGCLNYLLVDFGLALNLLYPNLNWTNVTVPTKQSLPVIISMICGLAYCMLWAIGGYYLSEMMSVPCVVCICAVTSTVLRSILWRWIKTKGAEIYSHL